MSKANIIGLTFGLTKENSMESYSIRLCREVVDLISGFHFVLDVLSSVTNFFFIKVATTCFRLMALRTALNSIEAVKMK